MPHERRLLILLNRFLSIGDPFLGSKEKGEKYFDLSSDNLADFANEIKKIAVEIKDRSYDTRSWEY
jgi:hypothetical protein